MIGIKKSNYNGGTNNTTIQDGEEVGNTCNNARKIPFYLQPASNFSGRL